MFYNFRVPNYGLLWSTWVAAQPWTWWRLENSKKVIFKSYWGKCSKAWIICIQKWNYTEISKVIFRLHELHEVCRFWFLSYCLWAVFFSIKIVRILQKLGLFFTNQMLTLKNYLKISCWRTELKICLVLIAKWVRVLIRYWQVYEVVIVNLHSINGNIQFNQ